MYTASHRLCASIVILLVGLTGCSVTHSATVSPVPTSSTVWMLLVEYARGEIPSSANEYIVLLDVNAGINRSENLSYLDFTFADKESLHTVDILIKDTTMSTLLTETSDIQVGLNINNHILDMNDIVQRERQIARIQLSPQEAIERLFESYTIPADCFNRLLNVASYVTHPDNGQSEAPYWTVVFPKCQGQYISIDIDAQNGEIMNDIRYNISN